MSDELKQALKLLPTDMAKMVADDLAYRDRIRAETLREAADRAVEWQDKLCNLNNSICDCDACLQCTALRAAIMGKEAEK
jgi:hypothetical protein